MIAGSHERVIERENTFFGSGQDENVVGRDLFVDRGDCFAQPGSAGRFRIAAPMLEEALVGSRLEVEEFLDRAGLSVGAGQQVLGCAFVLAEILCDSKGLNLHGKESGKAAGCTASAKLALACFRFPARESG